MGWRAAGTRAIMQQGGGMGRRGIGRINAQDIATAALKVEQAAGLGGEAADEAAAAATIAAAAAGGGAGKAAEEGGAGQQQEQQQQQQQERQERQQLEDSQRLGGEQQLAKSSRELHRQLIAQGLQQLKASQQRQRGSSTAVVA